MNSLAALELLYSLLTGNVNSFSSEAEAVEEINTLFGNDEAVSDYIGDLDDGNGSATSTIVPTWDGNVLKVSFVKNPSSGKIGFHGQFDGIITLDEDFDSSSSMTSLTKVLTNGLKPGAVISMSQAIADSLSNHDSVEITNGLIRGTVTNVETGLFRMYNVNDASFSFKMKRTTNKELVAGDLSTTAFTIVPSTTGYYMPRIEYYNGTTLLYTYGVTSPTSVSAGSSKNIQLETLTGTWSSGYTISTINTALKAGTLVVKIVSS